MPVFPAYYVPAPNNIRLPALLVILHLEPSSQELSGLGTHSALFASNMDTCTITRSTYKTPGRVAPCALGMRFWAPFLPHFWAENFGHFFHCAAYHSVSPRRTSTILYFKISHVLLPAAPAHLSSWKTSLWWYLIHISSLVHTNMSHCSSLNEEIMKKQRGKIAGYPSCKSLLSATPYVVITAAGQTVYNRQVTTIGIILLSGYVCCSTKQWEVIVRW